MVAGWRRKRVIAHCRRLLDGRSMGVRGQQRSEGGGTRLLHEAAAADRARAPEAQPLGDAVHVEVVPAGREKLHRLALFKLRQAHRAVLALAAGWRQ